LSQHCYVTGGTSGLGLALALLLAEQGADVSIVAPDENGLPVAKEKLEVRLGVSRIDRIQNQRTVSRASGNPRTKGSLITTTT